MKLFRLTWMLAAAALIFAQADSALQRAIRKETIEGDLKGAIESYKKLSQDKDRTVAAKALVRMGECYEKLGDSEARKAYERVEKEFGDQKESAETAHVRLAVLGKTGGPTGPTTRVVMSEPLPPGPQTGIFLTISPDGRSLVRIDRDGLTLRDLGSGSVRRLLSGSFAPGIGFSPDSKRIVLTQSVNDAVELWIVGADGTGARSLVRGASGSFLAAAWYPDNRRLLVMNGPRNGNFQISTLSVADGSRVVLGEHKGIFDWALSPDGTTIAYSAPVSEAPERDELRFLSLADFSESVVFSEPGTVDTVIWAPSGKGIVYMSDRRDPEKVNDLMYLALADGKAAGQPVILKRDFGYGALLQMSNDGTLFYQEHIDGREVFGVETGDNGNVTGAPVRLSKIIRGPSSAPAYSPDGHWLLYNRPREKASLILHSLDSGEERGLEMHFGGQNPYIWFPDGKSLLTTGCLRESVGQQECGAFRVDVATGNATLLKEGIIEAFPAISADGRTIYYTQRTENAPPQVTAWEIGSLIQRAVFSDAKVRNIGTVTLSPDERELATVIRDGTDSVLVALSTTRRSKREIYRVKQPEALGDVQWSKDGRSLVFTRSDGSHQALCRVGAQGGAVEEIGLSSSGIGRIVIHPDGRHIAYVQSASKIELTAMEGYVPKTK